MWSTLTTRERDVLQMVAAGGSAKEIAIQLHIAPRTVEKHLDHVRLKVRAKNRAHMVAMAMQAGAIDGRTGLSLPGTSETEQRELSPRRFGNRGERSSGCDFIIQSH
jgi:DNA-binding CsgD family transcriptional regulator